MSSNTFIKITYDQLVINQESPCFLLLHVWLMSNCNDECVIQFNMRTVLDSFNEKNNSSSRNKYFSALNDLIINSIWSPLINLNFENITVNSLIILQLTAKNKTFPAYKNKWFKITYDSFSIISQWYLQNPSLTKIDISKLFSLWAYICFSDSYRHMIHAQHLPKLNKMSAVLDKQQQNLEEMINDNWESEWIPNKNIIQKQQDIEKLQNKISETQQKVSEIGLWFPLPNNSINKFTGLSKNSIPKYLDALVDAKMINVKNIKVGKRYQRWGIVLTNIPVTE